MFNHFRGLIDDLGNFKYLPPGSQRSSVLNAFLSSVNNPRAAFPRGAARYSLSDPDVVEAIEPW